MCLVSGCLKFRKAAFVLLALIAWAVITYGLGFQALEWLSLIEPYVIPIRGILLALTVKMAQAKLPVTAAGKRLSR